MFYPPPPSLYKVKGDCFSLMSEMRTNKGENGTEGRRPKGLKSKVFIHPLRASRSSPLSQGDKVGDSALH